MTKEELVLLIEGFGRDLPKGITGNEENAILAEKVSGIVQSERTVLIELLRDWLAVRIPQSERKDGDGIREGRMWFALEVAKKYEIIELHTDIDNLITDVRSRKTYLPYYEDMIKKYRRALH